MCIIETIHKTTLKPLETTQQSSQYSSVVLVSFAWVNSTIPEG